MRRTRLAVVVATAMLAGTFVQASPAQAAVTVGDVSLSTTRVILDGDAGCGNRTKITAQVNGPKDELLVAASVMDPSGRVVDVRFLSPAGQSGVFDIYSDWVFLCGFRDIPGRYRVVVDVLSFDEDLEEVHVVTRDLFFYVQRPSSLTYNAAPEPVRRGGLLTHKGRLLLDPYASGPKVGQSGVRLAISFKKAGTSSYVTKGYAVTTRGGYYSRKLTASYDGTWRVSYAGGSARQPVSRTDYVNVL